MGERVRPLARYRYTLLLRGERSKISDRGDCGLSHTYAGVCFRGLSHSYIGLGFRVLSLTYAGVCFRGLSHSYTGVYFRGLSLTCAGVCFRVLSDSYIGRMLQGTESLFHRRILQGTELLIPSKLQGNVHFNRHLLRGTESLTSAYASKEWVTYDSEEWATLIGANASEESPVSRHLLQGIRKNLNPDSRSYVSGFNWLHFSY
jgi:hypothetical protein